MSNNEEDAMIIIMHQLAKGMKLIDEEIDALRECMATQKEFNDYVNRTFTTCLSTQQIIVKAVENVKKSVSTLESNMRTREEERTESTNNMYERLHGIETRLKDIEREYLR